MPMLSTQLLAELIRRKHAVLLQLCDIGCRQMEIADRGETSALLQILATKQTMISVLQEIERAMAPFHAENPDARIWTSPRERAECAQQAAECNRLLEEVLALEKQSVDHMIARRNEVATQLQQAYTSGQARSAYEAQRMPTSLSHTT